MTILSSIHNLCCSLFCQYCTWSVQNGPFTLAPWRREAHTHILVGLCIYYPIALLGLYHNPILTKTSHSTRTNTTRSLPSSTITAAPGFNYPTTKYNGSWKVETHQIKTRRRLLSHRCRHLYTILVYLHGCICLQTQPVHRSFDCCSYVNRLCTLPSAVYLWLFVDRECKKRR